MAEWPNSVARKSHEWRLGNPFLPSGVRCIETDTGREKVGDGKRWNDTPYLVSESILNADPEAGGARYFIPTRDEWMKAGFYDPTLNSNAGGWWTWATQSDTDPAFISGTTDDGDGIPAEDGNSFASGHVITWSGDTEGKGFVSVGTSGGASHYGTFDQHGNVLEITEGGGGGAWDDLTRFSAMGGTSEFNVTGQVNYGPRYNLKYSVVNGTRGYAWYGLRVASLVNPDALDNFVDVGDAGNTADDRGINDMHGLGMGAVAYEYKMNKYEVTNAEYCDFLNAIAGDDTYSMYEEIATSGGFSGYGHGDGIRGGIRRRGTPGNYYYEVIANFANKPAGYLSWHRAARYCNWLHNGKPVGPQIAATTEQGAYTLDGEVNSQVTRNS